MVAKEYENALKLIPDNVDLFGYPDSLIRARTAKAYSFAVERLPIEGKRVLDYGTGFGHGALRILLEKPSFLACTGRFDGALKLQKEHLASFGRVEFVQTKDYLPFASNQFDVVFLHHVIEHLTSSWTPFFLQEVKRVLVPDGILSLATPNAKEIIKPVHDGHDYTSAELELLHADFFDERMAFSLIADRHALSVHRRKQFLAKIPGTGWLRDRAPDNWWEFLYGTGKNKVKPENFHYVEGFDEAAIDFLVFCKD